MKDAWKYHSAIGACIATIIAVHILRPGGEAFPVIAASIDIASVAGATAIGLRTTRYFGFSTNQGKSMAFLTLMLFSMLMSDLVWLSSTRMLVSFQDMLYIISYPLLFASIFYGFKTLGLEFNGLKMLAYIIIFFLAEAVLIMAFASAPGRPLLDAALIHTFGLLDAALLIPTLFIVRKSLHGFFSKPWTAISIAIALSIAGHMIIGAAEYKTYEFGGTLDTLMYTSYILFGSGLFLMRRSSLRVVRGVRDGLHKNNIRKDGKRLYRT